MVTIRQKYESRILEILQDKSIITRKELIQDGRKNTGFIISLYSSVDTNIDKVLKNLRNRNVIKKIGRGKYIKI